MDVGFKTQILPANDAAVAIAAGRRFRLSSETYEEFRARVRAFLTRGRSG